MRKCEICDHEYEPKRYGSGRSRTCSEPECKRELRRRRLRGELEPKPGATKAQLAVDKRAEELMKRLADDMPSDEQMLWYSTPYYQGALDSESQES